MEAETLRGKRTLLSGLVVFLAAGAVATWVMRRAQQRGTSAQVAHLLSRPPSRPAPTIEGLDSLPPPVARYLRLALPDATPIRSVRLRQTGTLRTDVRSDRWMRFEAEHVVAPPAVGFVWSARVAVAPLLHVRVRDAYVDGEGSGHVSFLSAFPVHQAAGTVEMNAGSLHRFLAEAVWYPTALLPSATLQWSPIDDHRATARLTDRGTSVALEFRFAGTGEVTGIYTPARWGAFPGGYERRPWEGHFRNYERRNGFLMPTEGDVGWYEHGEWRMVWKGTISRVTIDE